MYFVYILQSINTPEHLYVGYSLDVDKRLKEHNSGQSTHTNKFRPWKIRTAIRFDDENRAKDFEIYLKSSSGRAFMSKRF